MIRWSKRAFADFQSIHNFIAADNPEAARQQCVFIYESIDQLNKFPRSGKAKKRPQTTCCRYHEHLTS